MGFFKKRPTSRIPLDDINALMTASNVTTHKKGQSLSYKGLIGETRIDVAPSGFRTVDGLEVSEIVHIESVLDTPPLPGKEEMECALNNFASNGALVVDDDGKFRIKSRLSLYSGEGEDVIKVYTGVIFVGAMIHTNALQAATVELLKLPVSKSAPLPKSTLDGKWKPSSFSRSASMLKARGAFVNTDERGLTAEFPWDPGAITAIESLITRSRKCTSLLQIQCEEHPSLGKGLFCRLDLPLNLSDAEAYKLASCLNQMEFTAEDWPPLLGAWTSQPKSGRPTFVSFWPNMFSTVIDVEMIAMWMGARSFAMPGWLRDNAGVKQ
jgi:hypothetical protein